MVIIKINPMSHLHFYDGSIYIDQEELQLLKEHVPFFQSIEDSTISKTIDHVSKYVFKKLVVLLLYGKHPTILSDVRIFQLAKEWGGISLLIPWTWELPDLYHLTHMDQHEHDTESSLRLMYHQNNSVKETYTISLFETYDFTKSRYPFMYPRKLATSCCKSIPSLLFLDRYPNELWVVGEALVNHIKRLPINVYDYYFTCSEARAYLILQDIYEELRIILDYVSRTEQCVTFYTYHGEYRIHLTLYQDVQHILVHQYVDCCCIATNGTDLITLPRGYHSIQYGIIIVNPYVCDDTYMDQLVWFSKKGFLLQCPGWKNEWEDDVAHKGDLYQSYYSFSGLRKLAWCIYHSIHPSTHYELCKSTTLDALPYYVGRFDYSHDKIPDQHRVIPYALSHTLDFSSVPYVFKQYCCPPPSFPTPLSFTKPVLPTSCPTFYQWFILKNEI